LPYQRKELFSDIVAVVRETVIDSWAEECQLQCRASGVRVCGDDVVWIGATNKAGDGVISPAAR